MYYHQMISAMPHKYISFNLSWSFGTSINRSLQRDSNYLLDDDLSSWRNLCRSYQKLLMIVQFSTYEPWCLITISWLNTKSWKDSENLRWCKNSIRVQAKWQLRIHTILASVQLIKNLQPKVYVFPFYSLSNFKHYFILF